MKTILLALIVAVMFVSVSAQMTVEDAAKSALNVGAKIPAFTLNDAMGKATSVENADRSQAIAKKNELTYTVLSDPNLDVARMFKIVYQMPDALNERYKSGGLDVAKYNSMDKAELPISATYIVNKKGEITYAHIEPDYKKRPTPDEIIAALAKLGK